MGAEPTFRRKAESSSFQLEDLEQWVSIHWLLPHVYILGYGVKGENLLGAGDGSAEFICLIRGVGSR